MLLLMNAGIIYGISKNSFKSNIDDDKQKVQTRQLAKMALFASIAFIILTVPNGVWRIYHVYFPVKLSDGNIRYLKFFVVHKLLNLGWILNASVNFYVYCLGGGKAFRKDAKRLLASCRSTE